MGGHADETAGTIPSEEVDRGRQQLARAPYERHALPPLLAAAWGNRANVRLIDALYIALADELGAPLLTLDRGLASATARGELIDV